MRQYFQKHQPGTELEYALSWRILLERIVGLRFARTGVCQRPSVEHSKKVRKNYATIFMQDLPVRRR